MTARRALSRKALTERALHLWRHNQRDNPRFTYRHNPDEIDFATGAWARVVNMAFDELKAEKLKELAE